MPPPEPTQNAGYSGSGPLFLYVSDYTIFIYFSPKIVSAFPCVLFLGTNTLHILAAKPLQ